MGALAARKLVIPDEGEVRQAQHAAQRLADFRREGSPVFLLWEDEGSDEGPRSMPIPDETQQPLAEILAAQAAGDAVAVLPVHTEYTTGQAAAILNVDHSHLLELIADGQFAALTLDGEQMVPLSEILDFGGRDEGGRAELLHELAQQYLKIGLTGHFSRER